MRLWALVIVVGALAGAVALGNQARGEDDGLPLPPRPKTGAAASPATPPSNAPPANAACPAPAPIAKEQLLGQWTDSATGETLEIKPAPGGGLSLNGRNLWVGELQGGKLNFTRTPSLDQLAYAPDWARQQAVGKVKWQLELEVRDECGQLVLDGQWYPGSYKWSETVTTGAAPLRSVSDFGRGTPTPKKYTKPPPAIADVIVLTEQTRLNANGDPVYPYAAATTDRRLLFVYGSGLPRSWNGPLEFKSEDGNVKYYAIALSSENNLAPLRREQFELGWAEARKNLDEATIEKLKGLDAILVEAQTTSTVLPGLKQFTLNGLDGSWRLRFGDDRASLSFMRAIAEDVADPAKALFLPERAFVELRTAADLPLQSIALKLQLGGADVTWNGAPTLSARKMAPGVYRTDFIEFVEARNALPPPEPGVFFLHAKVKDQVVVRLEDPYLLGLTPAALVTPLLRSPADLGETWKEALNRAARADGIDSFTDWNKLSASKATEISNYIVSPILLKVTESATPLKFLRVIPKAYKFVEELENSRLVETTPVTVGEHAALLLFRDQFVKDMSAALANLEQIKGDAALRGFREAVKYSAWDERSPWRYLKVSCPGGTPSLSPRSAGSVVGKAAPVSGDCNFPMAVSDSYLEQRFGKDRRAADAWVRQAIDQALANYKQAAREAIDKAQAIEDKDIKGLLKLVGYTYHPMLPALQARMMRLAEVGTPKRQLWVPDLNGRYQLRNLHTVVDAVQAQEDYSSLDTQMAMLLVAALTAPFMLEEGVLGAVIAWGSDALQLGVALAVDVPEFIRSREEVRFALGASLILGTQRLQEAELRKSEWYSLLASLGQSTVGAAMSTARMVGVVRTSLILRSVERGGVSVYRALSEADKAAFWRFASEAKLLEEAGELKSLNAMHKRVGKAADEVLVGLGYKNGPVAAKPKPTVAAIGQAGPRPAEQPKTLKLPDNAGEDKLLATDQGVAYRSEQDTLTLGDQARPQDKTRTLTGEVNEPGKPGGANEPAKNPPASPAPPTAPPVPDKTITYGADKPNVSAAMPKAGDQWTTIYKGRARSFRLGERLGGGQYAQVFELLDSGIPGCEQGCAVKIVLPDPRDAFFGSAVLVDGKPVSVVENIRYSSSLVDAAGDIPQLRNLEFYPDAPLPYFIQQTRRADQALFANLAQFKAAAAKIPELRSAVVELAHKLRSHGLIWEDFKVNNMVFWKDAEGKFGPKGKWVAGVLDHDRIVPFAKRDLPGNMSAWAAWMEADYLPNNLKSMRKVGKSLQIDRASDMVNYFRDHPGPYYRDIDMFWEKIFEAKKWIDYDETTGRFVPNALQPSDVQIRFQKLNNRTRLDPFDPAIEFNLPRQGSWNVLPFPSRNSVAQRDLGQWRAAA